MPLRTYSSGGIAESPQLALYGEGQYREAYVPLPDGRSIPVTMRDSGGGNSIVMHIDLRGADESIVPLIDAKFAKFGEVISRQFPAMARDMTMRRR